YPRFRCLRVLSSLFLLPPTPPPAIYTLSLHDALPIYLFQTEFIGPVPNGGNFIGNRTTLLHIHHLEQPHKHDTAFAQRVTESRIDRKSTRLNSSHGSISYAVFCLKKKTNKKL